MIPTVVQLDCCFHQQRYHRPTACLTDFPAMPICSHARFNSSLSDIYHVLYLMLWCFPEATVAGDSSALTWHSYTCNPDVWEVDASWGNVYQWTLGVNRCPFLPSSPTTMDCLTFQCLYIVSKKTSRMTVQSALQATLA